jgi:hypothetical protein
LKSDDQSTRFLCALGLVSLQPSIAQDKAKLAQTVGALRAAGETEQSVPVLTRIYLALAYPGQLADVFDAYVALFDKRLEVRRGSAVFADRAEVDAFEFFRRPGVTGALSADQKVALARRIAVFLRLDALRYSTDDLKFTERECLERRLTAAEDCLEALVGSGQGGDIRSELKLGGHDRREAILQQAYRWIGHPTTRQNGTLNSSPWNVPLGAP